jgi:3-hydroxyisobutyrate dehydrogenase-like beta-hydroxyacid dehydrogenase
MAKLGFCGLGAMGAPMARRLLAAGHDVTVWNRTAEKAQALAGEGASVAATPAAAADGADAVITMLATPEALEMVVFGKDGLAGGIERGTTLIEMSTVGPATMHAIAGRFKAADPIVDAPVLGSIGPASEGTLRIFVGGTTDQFIRWSPVLESMGRPMHVGPFGSGAAMKVVVNSTLGTSLCAFAEALALADALGLDRSLAFEVLEASPLGAVARSRRTSVETGEYPARFRLSLARKDMELAEQACSDAGLDDPVIEAAAAWFRRADGEGFADRDYAAVVAYALEAGRTRPES